MCFKKIPIKCRYSCACARLCLAVTSRSQSDSYSLLEDDESFSEPADLKSKQKDFVY
jgi:hypothetical protein